MVEEIFARKGQSLLEHLRLVNKAYLKNAKNRNELERIAILLHDGAKVSSKFQENLKGKSNKFRHPLVILAVAEHILKKYVKTADDKELILYYLISIYFHHNVISFDTLQNDIIRLTNLINSSQYKEELDYYILTEQELENLERILKDQELNINFDHREFIKSLKEFDQDFKKAYVSKLLETLKDFYKYLKESDWEKKFKFASFYSNLVESDWEGSALEQRKIIDWNKLESSYKQHYMDKFGTRDIFKSKVKEEVLKLANSNKCFLIAPTGVGKSEISLFWALKKAKEKNAKRIIYVLPFCVLIEDLYKRFQEYVGEENVDKWDSNWLEDKLINDLKKEENQDQNLLEIFNFYKINRKYFFKSPVIITTADQILLSFFNLERYPIRLGLFKDSVFVFDEIQGYGTLMRNLLYNFIEIACKENPVMVMTATPPEEAFLELAKKDFEKISNKNWWEQLQNKRDVKVNFVEISISKSDKSSTKKKNSDKKFFEKIKEIIKHNKDKKRIAIIVNTVKKSIDIFRELKNEEDIKNIFEVLLLHGSLRKNDRKEVLEKILNKNNTKPFIVVSTQVIEAGIDVSFDLMVRQIAPLPSIIQSLGRVNRNGESKDSHLYLVLFEEEVINNFTTPYDPDEVKRINIYFIEKKESIKNKRELENVSIEYESDYTIKREFGKYITKIAVSSIWSVKDIENIIGEGLRGEVIKNTVFVGTKQEKEQLEQEIQKLRKELKENTEKNHYELFANYIDKIKEMEYRTISVFNKEKFMEKEKYYKEYYPIDDSE